MGRWVRAGPGTVSAFSPGSHVETAGLSRVGQQGPWLGAVKWTRGRRVQPTSVLQDPCSSGCWRCWRGSSALSPSSCATAGPAGSGCSRVSDVSAGPGRRVLCASLAWSLPCPALPAEALGSWHLQSPPDVIPELHLCYPVQTFQPKPEAAGKWSGVRRGCLSRRDTRQAGPWAWGSLLAASHKLRLSL